MDKFRKDEIKRLASAHNTLRLTSKLADDDVKSIINLSGSKPNLRKLSSVQSTRSQKKNLGIGDKHIFSPLTSAESNLIRRNALKLPESSRLNSIKSQKIDMKRYSDIVSTSKYFSIGLRYFAIPPLLLKGGGKLIKGLNSKGASALSMGLGIAGGVSGLAGGLKNLSDKQQFSVVYNTPSGPKHKSVKAKSPMDAISSVKSSAGNVSQARAFRLPDQDDQSQQYFESLNNKTMSSVIGIYFDTETRQFSTREEKKQRVIDDRIKRKYDRLIEGGHTHEGAIKKLKLKSKRKAGVLSALNALDSVGGFMNYGNAKRMHKNAARIGAVTNLAIHGGLQHAIHKGYKRRDLAINKLDNK